MIQMKHKFKAFMGYVCIVWEVYLWSPCFWSCFVADCVTGRGARLELRNIISTDEKPLCYLNRNTISSCADGKPTLTNGFITIRFFNVAEKI